MVIFMYIYVYIHNTWFMYVYMYVCIWLHTYPMHICMYMVAPSDAERGIISTPVREPGLTVFTWNSRPVSRTGLTARRLRLDQSHSTFCAIIDDSLTLAFIDWKAGTNDQRSVSFDRKTMASS